MDEIEIVIQDTRSMCKYHWFVGVDHATFDSKRLSDLIDHITNLQAENEKLKAENEFVKYNGIYCESCKHFINESISGMGWCEKLNEEVAGDDCDCAGWKWRGLEGEGK